MNGSVFSNLCSRQFLVFVTGGLASATIDIGTLILLLHLKFETLPATTLGYIFGLTVNYLYHARLTFEAPKSFSSFIRFVVVVGLNYGLTIGFVFLAQLLEFNVVAGKLISLPVVAINGFILSKYWVFQ